MTDDGERIAKLETKVDGLQRSLDKHIEDDDRNMKNVTNEIHSNAKTLTEIRTALWIVGGLVTLAIPILVKYVLP